MYIVVEPCEGGQMNGQWLSRYAGTNTGTLVIDLDDMGTHYEGRAVAWDDNAAMPSTFVIVRTKDKITSQQVRVDTLPMDPRSSEPTTWTALGALFPGVIFPTYADVKLALVGNTLEVSWTTDIGTFGAASMPRSKADTPSDYNPLHAIVNWEDFKAYVNGLEHRRYIFRGQERPWRLRTGFHRTGRADLSRFLSEDVRTLHRHLSQRTTHVFNLNVPDENGAFFNLVQHHGYPTPLLDWTYSPYVAAFFAYHKIRNATADAADPDQKVRVFTFDQKLWRAKFPQVPKVFPARPHFSMMEFIAIDNERLIPQQSISSLANIDDIETHIKNLETTDSAYLRVIDLPVRDRRAVMTELSTMGITAGSLFPGFDGACEELRERFFRS